MAGAALGLMALLALLSNSGGGSRPPQAAGAQHARPRFREQAAGDAGGGGAGDGGGGAEGRQRGTMLEALRSCEDFACLRAAHVAPRGAARFNFPHFVIIGWQKAATTSLHA